MNFESALSGLKAGQRWRRSIWQEDARKYAHVRMSLYGEQNLEYDGCDSHHGVPFVPSWSDLFADDWACVDFQSE